MGFLSCVDQIVFLQVGQLSETFIAGLALKGSFTAMDSQVHLKIKTGKLVTTRSVSNRCVAHICYSSKRRHSSLAYLEIGKLTKSLGADIALILDLPVLLLKWVI